MAKERFNLVSQTMLVKRERAPLSYDVYIVHIPDATYIHLQTTYQWLEANVLLVAPPRNHIV